ncbi:MAG: GIY-YIG nuclease family protein [Candidatus Shapirobacteria bacterium]
MYFVYILINEEGKYYVGYTSDPGKRIKKHNSGGSKFTRNKGAWKLVYKEEYKNKSEAFKREKQIKSYKGGNAFKALLSSAYGQSPRHR